MEFKIIRNMHGITKPTGKRISWPWKDMSIGDQVQIPLELAGRGQVGCHVYGRGAGKKFKTWRLDDASLMVERIE